MACGSVAMRTAGEVGAIGREFNSLRMQGGDGVTGWGALLTGFIGLTGAAGGIFCWAGGGGPVTLVILFSLHITSSACDTANFFYALILSEYVFTMFTAIMAMIISTKGRRMAWGW